MGKESVRILGNSILVSEGCQQTTQGWSHPEHPVTGPGACDSSDGQGSSRVEAHTSELCTKEGGSNMGGHHRDSSAWGKEGRGVLGVGVLGVAGGCVGGLVG